MPSSASSDSAHYSDDGFDNFSHKDGTSNGVNGVNGVTHTEQPSRVSTASKQGKKSGSHSSSSSSSSSSSKAQKKVPVKQSVESASPKQFDTSKNAHLLSKSPARANGHAPTANGSPPSKSSPLKKNNPHYTSKSKMLNRSSSRMEAVPKFDKQAIAKDTAVANELTQLQRENTMLSRRKADSYGTQRLLETQDKLKVLESQHEALLRENKALRIVTTRQKKEAYHIKRVVLGPDVAQAEEEIRDLRRTHEDLRNQGVTARKEINAQTNQISKIGKRIERLTGMLEHADAIANWARDQADFERDVEELQRKIDQMRDEKEADKRMHERQMRKTNQMIDEKVNDLNQLSVDLQTRDFELRSFEVESLVLDRIVSPEKKSVSPGQVYVRPKVSKELKNAQRAKILSRNREQRHQFREGLVLLHREVARREVKRQKNFPRKSLAAQFADAVDPLSRSHPGPRPQSSPRLTPLNLNTLNQSHQPKRSATSFGYYPDPLPNHNDIASRRQPQPKPQRVRSPHGRTGPMPLRQRDGPSRRPVGPDGTGTFFLTQGVNQTPTLSARYGPNARRPAIQKVLQQPRSQQSHLHRSRDGFLG